MKKTKYRVVIPMYTKYETVVNATSKEEAEEMARNRFDWVCYDVGM